MTIRLLIADDHQWVREGLRYALADSGIEIVGEASDGDEALQLALCNEFDVLLLDISMPGRDGLDVLQELKLQRPESCVLIYSNHDRADYRTRAEQFTASGYVLKTAARGELIDAIHKAGQGEELSCA